MPGQTPYVTAQSLQPWSPQQVIPNYADKTWPPILVADQNRTVHAFASQPVGDEQQDVGIVYSQWTLEAGWTDANDILLSPVKNAAQVMDALLDETGTMHLVFYGGDQTEANIYYSFAPAVDANRAPAWSAPRLIGESALSPSEASMVGDQQDNLAILYSGDGEGNGLYSIYSDDGGNTWSDPDPMYLADSEELWPYDLHLYLDESGWVHAIWNTVSVAGQGQGIFYARLQLGETQWSDPIELSEGEKVLSLGTMTPAIIKLEDTAYALYNVRGRIVMRRSGDNGRTWTDSTEIFSRHVGVNGKLSPVVDSAGTLHLFFGQRITGNPDIHGMWHSTWDGDRWLEPEAVVSGPRIVDAKKDESFDPYNARAIVSQGNTLLVTWRTDPDPNIKDNGVWYSYQTLPVPDLQAIALPRPSVTAAPTPAPTIAVVEATPTAILYSSSAEPSSETVVSRISPATLMTVGLGPTFLLILAIALAKGSIQRWHHK